MTTASNIDDDIGTYRRRCHRSEKARDALLAITVPGASASATATAAAIGRGVNFGNMLEAPSEGAWGLTVTDDFIDKAAAAGFTSVRLPVRWSNHASVDAPFPIHATFMARVESVVDKLLAKGFVVVVNMHHYRQLDGDPLDASEFPAAAAALDVRFVMMWEQLATRMIR
jgi:endoglucanase